jgi:hypothetical protein
VRENPWLQLLPGFAPALWPRREIRNLPNLPEHGAVFSVQLGSEIRGSTTKTETQALPEQTIGAITSDQKK